MNNRQRQILRRWWCLLPEYVEREWKPYLLWSAIGAAIAAANRLILFDKKFAAMLRDSYLPKPTSFDNPSLYRPYIAVILIAICAFILVSGFQLAVRGLHSWLAGCTSGARFFACVLMFYLVAFSSSTLGGSIRLFVTANAAFFISSYALHLFGRVKAERTPSEEDFTARDVRPIIERIPSSNPDEPIGSWDEDVLGRSAIVDILRAKATVAKVPIIAVSGPFGSGKTSVLNLLRLRLMRSAIVISFSAWLPGSQDTLATYLLSDISNECRKRYVIPGLGPSTRRLARAVAEALPVLKGYVEIFGASTQRDDIENLKRALSRIPKRVVVLLDELDRMEKDEVLTLLKVLRGVSHLPNITFVCAVDTEELIRIVKDKPDNENRRYFEKFFPVSIRLPDADARTLTRFGVERVTVALDQRGWFLTSDEKEKFQSALGELWDRLVSGFCTNLREVGLIANDVGIAAALLKREVDPVDLVLVEMLKRFRPPIYSLIAENGVALTGGESVIRGGKYISDVTQKRLYEDFEARRDALAEGNQDRERIKAVVSYLFPSRDGHRAPVVRGLSAEIAQPEKRISEPSMFPAYFRYEVPEAVFSSTKLEGFLSTFQATEEDQGKVQVFRAALTKLQKGSLIRDDFLYRLSEASKRLETPVAIDLARVAVRLAEEFTYDMFMGFGEAGHVVRIVLRACQGLPRQEQLSILRDCIATTTDDTMALTLTARVTDPKSGANLAVSFVDVYPSFIARMRRQYGVEADVTKIDLSRADPEAFNLWGFKTANGVDADPADREIQKEFWLRWIGDSKDKLAEAFDKFILPKTYHYPEDPTGFVENKIPIAELRKLFSQIDEPKSSGEPLTRLQSFLSGAFSNGVPLHAG